MPKRDLNSFFKLRIAAGYYIGRRDLDIEIRGNSDIFYSQVVPLGSYAARFGRRIWPLSMSDGVK